jgi:autotransporter translocation and assembly factor TamB
LTGPSTAVKLTGDATIHNLAAAHLDALTTTGHYEVGLPSGTEALPSVRINGQATFLTAWGQHFETATGTLTLANRRLDFNLSAAQAGGRSGSVSGDLIVDRERRAMEVDDFEFTLGRAPWKLVRDATPPVLTWSDEGIAITPVVFLLAGNTDQRIGLGGTWRRDGNGQLRVTATHVFLETLQGAFEAPARYGGVLDVDGTISGTPGAPIFAGQLSIRNGRVQRLSYEKLEARIEFSQQVFHVDARLDQSSGAWLTAVGSVPLSALNRSLPDHDIDVAIKSSPISLGLIEGVTDVVRNVGGEARVDMRVIGSVHDPLFEGSVALTNTAFLVTATGARYKNGRASFSLARDRIVVDQLHVEDNGGHSLDVHGSLGTRELRVGDLVIDATARRFTVIRNELGELNVDANLQLRGRFETPKVSGDVTVASGNLKVDAILERTLFRPYSTEETPLPAIDAVAALNPWDRLSLDITLDVPETLRLTGENVQVSPGTPIGIGNFNLRVGGDLSLYKDAGQPLSITGSLDSIAGTYAFQGRAFEVDESSSINFRGDLKPEIDLAVTRLISGVLARVSLTGSLDNPRLELSSTPPLDPSEVLSLIVFNASLSDLSAVQQQELAVRAATLAAGFLAQPLVSAIEGSLGLETLNVEPSSDVVNTGPRVTVGEEIAPGLVARFSRQFGQDPYDLATIEYNLSRLFRIRASFSDAASLLSVSPFRRIERAGMDLLFVFSF